MHSMTGYGRMSLERDGRQITVEMRSVNNRFLDLSFRMPRSFNCLEDAMRAQIGASLFRGHVDLFVTYRNNREDSRSVSVDGAILSAYMRAYDQIAAQHEGLRDDRTLSGMARLPEVMTLSEAEEDQEALSALTKEALAGAIDQMLTMRSREGERLKEDIAHRVDLLEEMTGKIEARYPETVAEYESRLKARVLELLEGQSVDETRLLTEVAIMADRSAIAEETVRLHSHFTQIRALLDDPEPVGRRLDFLVQELNREVNTISSKSQDVPITQIVIAAKAEIEKIREQVQNVE